MISNDTILSPLLRTIFRIIGLVYNNEEKDVIDKVLSTPILEKILNYKYNNFGDFLRKTILNCHFYAIISILVTYRQKRR